MNGNDFQTQVLSELRSNRAELAALKEQIVAHHRRTDHKLDVLNSSILELRADVREIYEQLRTAKGVS